MYAWDMTRVRRALACLLVAAASPACTGLWPAPAPTAPAPAEDTPAEDTPAEETRSPRPARRPSYATVTPVPSRAPIRPAGPDAVIFHLWSFPSHRGSWPDSVTLTREGLALHTHPRARQLVPLRVLHGESNYALAPGQQWLRSHWATPEAVAEAWVGHQRHQRFMRADPAAAGQVYLGSFVPRGAGRLAEHPDAPEGSRDEALLYGSEADRVIGGPDPAERDAMQRSPFARYGPFFAASEPGMARRELALAQRLKAECDTAGACYPEAIILDTEHVWTIYAGASGRDIPWQDYYDGLPAAHRPYPNRSELIHGRRALAVWYAGPEKAATLAKTGDSSRGEFVLVAGPHRAVVSGLGAGKTVRQVAHEISRASGWRAEVRAEGADRPAFFKPFGPADAKQPRARALELWAVPWAHGQKFRGWLPAAFNDPRAATETIYEEWDGSRWAPKTLADWKREVFDRISPVPDLARHCMDPRNAAFLPHVVGLAYRMMDYRIAKTVAAPWRLVLPGLRSVSNYGTFSADRLVPVGYNTSHEGYGPVRIQLDSAPSLYPVVTRGGYDTFAVGPRLTDPTAINRRYWEFKAGAISRATPPGRFIPWVLEGDYRHEAGYTMPWSDTAWLVNTLVTRHGVRDVVIWGDAKRTPGADAELLRLIEATKP